MALSDNRLKEISVLAHKRRIYKDGMTLCPAEIKREIKNMADTLGITVSEAAEFFETGMDYVYTQCKEALASMKETDKVGKQ